MLSWLVRAGFVKGNVSLHKSLKATNQDNNRCSLLAVQADSFMAMLSSTLVSFAPASALVAKLSSPNDATSMI